MQKTNPTLFFLDGEAPERQRSPQAGVDPGLSFVGAAMDQRIGHGGRQPAQGIGWSRGARIKKAGDAAHGRRSRF